jgi:aryl-alcohol dehydrogenase-like predicted oxidoreductase
MNRLAIGTAQFGLNYGIANHLGKVGINDVKMILDQAFLSGIDTLDTAIAYGDSEVSLGQAGIASFNVVTKLPEMPNDSDNVDLWISNHLTQSLNRLDATSLYGLLLHRPLQLLEVHGVELYYALHKLKNKGLVKKIGISIYSPSELDLLIPKFDFDLIQAPFNVFDQRLFHSGWLHRLSQTGIEVHVRSVFLQGLLLMQRSDIPVKFNRWSSLFDRWHNWICESELSAVEASLSFVLSYPEIDRVVVGVDSLNQLKQILTAMNVLKNSVFTTLNCEDELLINPVNWPNL